MRAETIERHEERVLLVLPYIAASLRDGATPSLVDLSRIANTAPHYFHRIFREYTGQPVGRFVRRLRLDFAAYRLLFTEQPVMDIAVECGYESQAASTRVFKQTFGVPPATFRRNAALSRPSVDVERPLTRALRRRKVAFLRYFGPHSGCGATWRTLLERAESLGIPTALARPIGIVHDEPDLCLGDDIRYDACIEVDADFRPTAGLGVQVIPESTYVVLPHRGPGNLLPCTYMRLVVDWVATGGPHTLATLPYYERYDDCTFLDRPADVRAEVQVRAE